MEIVLKRAPHSRREFKIVNQARDWRARPFSKRGSRFKLPQISLLTLQYRDMCTDVGRILCKTELSYGARPMGRLSFKGSRSVVKRNARMDL